MAGALAQAWAEDGDVLRYQSEDYREAAAPPGMDSPAAAGWQPAAQVRVPVGSRLQGVYLQELRLPRGSMVSLVVRDGEAFTPTMETRLRERDQLLVVATAPARRPAEERIRAVDLRGRLARWNQ